MPTTAAESIKAKREHSSRNTPENKHKGQDRNNNWSREAAPVFNLAGERAGLQPAIAALQQVQQQRLLACVATINGGNTNVTHDCAALDATDVTRRMQMEQIGTTASAKIHRTSWRLCFALLAIFCQFKDLCHVNSPESDFA
jgi:hypothetical protein